MSQWNLDLAHSTATFSAKHMMISTVRGNLAVTGGSINFDPANPAAASVEATLDTASINTGMGDRDNHLRSPDFLDAATYPTISFKSTKVEPTGEGTARVHGDLTIRDVTKPVVLEATLDGVGKDPFTGSDKAGFTATATINREDWGLTWNVALEAGGWLVGKEIKLTLEVEAAKVAETVAA
ncbi:MAG: YceI family protein [Chloroflexota bacterium]|nr:YceI family protein [Chloroflexota bacterium]